MKQCAKCKNPAKDGASLVEGGQQYSFCAFCYSILEKCEKTNIVHSFLRHNANEDMDIPMTFVQRNMLRAKEERDKGRTIWQKVGEIRG